MKRTTMPHSRPTINDQRPSVHDRRSTTTGARSTIHDPRPTIHILACCVLWLLPTVTFAADGNRLTYLDGNDPYFVSQQFPRLTTPQWVGEDGVDAVVILAIDDMNATAKYETFLRPILRRLQVIDGRAPVS